MTITLPDLVAATADYIDNQVTARVSDVTACLLYTSDAADE